MIASEAAIHTNKSTNPRAGLVRITVSLLGADRRGASMYQAECVGLLTLPSEAVWESHGPWDIQIVTRSAGGLVARWLVSSATCRQRLFAWNRSKFSPARLWFAQRGPIMFRGTNPWKACGGEISPVVKPGTSRPLGVLEAKPIERLTWRVTTIDGRRSPAKRTAVRKGYEGGPRRVFTRDMHAPFRGRDPADTRRVFGAEELGHMRGRSNRVARRQRFGNMRENCQAMA